GHQNDKVTLWPSIVKAALWVRVAIAIIFSMSPGLTRAIEKAGSMGKLARMLGISQQAVSQWREVPTRHIIAIETATGVPREILRPDLYRRRRRKIAALAPRQKSVMPR